MVVFQEDDYLAHYGILRKSGRYPWGSGKDENTRNKEFLDYVSEMKKEGLSDVEIARGMGVSTTALRAAKSIATHQQREARISEIQRLKAKGMGNVAIGQRMGLNESTVRSLLAASEKDNRDVLQSTAKALKDQVDEKKFLDIGLGTENYMGVSQTRLNTAVHILKEQGYEVHDLNLPQATTPHFTRYKILVPPGTTRTDVFNNRDKVQQITTFSEDGGHNWDKVFKTPVSIDSKRVSVRYAEDGGKAADGVLFVRPGVKDVSLGKARYAQVRVMVDGTHYLKGMAMHKDDLPDGVDIEFNTNKNNTGNKLDAMKKITDDPDRPFGSEIKRQLLEGEGKDRRPYSAMNIVNEEGDWGEWSKELSSQLLSKQSPTLAKTQLAMRYEDKVRSYQEISKLTNPTVKKKLLETFADTADSSAVHMEAASFPRAAYQIILPISSLNPGEVYAPNYRHGERVALVRFPHGGTFEIPDLVVNNNHPESVKVIGKGAKDAIGIHPKVAERLSGADFDGDAVIVIPNDSRKVKHTPALEGLKGFDPMMYKLPDDSPIPKMDSDTKQHQMGKVTNLIADMTVRQAPAGDIARAVRHSMVVIDAEKHNLNWRQSAKDNGIDQLKEKYQGGARKGASTLISRATSETRVDERKPRSAARGGPVDKETGALVFEPTGRTRVTSTGERIPVKQLSTKLAETTDAHTLSSGTPIERVYAEHSNRMKALANKARLDAIHTPSLKRSPSAAVTYSKEVSSLDSKLALAVRNAPLERQAQIFANTEIRTKRHADPTMDAATLKKIKNQAIIKARARTGAGKTRVEITPHEWEAIQAGAISDSKLSQILNHADLDSVKKLATPKTEQLMTTTKTRRAQQMLANGYTRRQVADQLGVSLSTLDVAVKAE